jgi:hypothetical protein
MIRSSQKIEIVLKLYLYIINKGSLSYPLLFGQRAKSNLPCCSLSERRAVFSQRVKTRRSCGFSAAILRSPPLRLCPLCLLALVSLYEANRGSACVNPEAEGLLRPEREG